MKNTIFKLLEYSYYFLLIILFVFYLFPGSLIGYFLYGNLGQQPDLIPNPIGTSINHLISFTFLSSLAFVVRVREKKFINSFQFVFFISILLEMFHHFIPNRAFEYYDLFANFIGVIIAYLFIQLILKIIMK
ncbi:VanZ family protein [Candidatus Pelagibacter bacterium]|nr:VanZ family protein [Candidatus Pelagibacter bacterium]